MAQARNGEDGRIDIVLKPVTSHLSLEEVQSSPVTSRPYRTEMWHMHWRTTIESRFGARERGSSAPSTRRGRTAGTNGAPAGNDRIVTYTSALFTLELGNSCIIYIRMCGNWSIQTDGAAPRVSRTESTGAPTRRCEQIEESDGCGGRPGSA